MIYLIFYDISNNKIRNKIANRLIANGYERIQLSVFCGITNPRVNSTLWKTLQTLLSTETKGKFYVIKTSKNNFKQMDIINKIDWDFDYLLGIKSSLFI